MLEIVLKKLFYVVTGGIIIITITFLAVEYLFGYEEISNYWFGITSVLSLIISLFIFRKVRERRFTNSRELLNRYIEVFDDAIRSSKPGKKEVISILHFAPCPGLFDEMYKSDHTFDKYSVLIEKLKNIKDRVTLNVCMLDDTQREEYLKKFFVDEKRELPEERFRLKGIESYLASLNYS